MNGWDEHELVPIRDKVFEYLKDAILSGALKAGERIVERELAEKLNVSRTPIREALFRLESVGFVKTIPRKGVIVSRMTTEEIVEIFTILATLESLSVRLAAEKLDEEHEKKLDIIIDEMDRILEDQIQEKNYHQIHLEIRDTIHHAAKSPRLYELLKSQLEHIYAFASVSHETPEWRRKAFEEHREIALAIKQRDKTLAESLARLHIENSKEAYLRSIAKLL